MNSKSEVIKRRLMESSEIKALMSKDSELVSAIGEAVDCIVSTYQNGGKVLFCGNGGSAADAQHLAAELSGKFYLDRAPLDAEALHVNTSYVTAVANDYSFEDVFSRAVEGRGKEGDILVAISTSGNSNNVIKAIISAKSKGMKVIGMSGGNGGKMSSMCDILLRVPSSDTPRIQEGHITIGHIICELVEEKLFAE